MTFEATIEGIVRRVVREELRAAGGSPRPSEPEPDLVKLGEVRRWVQVSRSFLKSRIAAGALPAYGQGRLIRVRLVDVRALLERRPPRARAASPLTSVENVSRILASVPGGRR